MGASVQPHPLQRPHLRVQSEVPGQEEAVSGAPLWSMSKCSQRRGKGEGIVTSGERREEYEQ